MWQLRIHPNGMGCVVLRSIAAICRVKREDQWMRAPLTRNPAST